MATFKVEQLGEQLVVRLTADATATLGLHPGDEVELGRRVHGEVSLAAADMDRQLRQDFKRACLRRFRTLS